MAGESIDAGIGGADLGGGSVAGIGAGEGLGIDPASVSAFERELGFARRDADNAALTQYAKGPLTGPVTDIPAMDRAPLPKGVPPLEEMARQRGHVGPSQRGPNMKGGLRGAGAAGVAIAAQALGKHGFQMQMARDVDRLASEHGIALDMNNPYHSAIAEEFTDNRGHSWLSQNVICTSGQCMTEQEAVGIVEHRLSELSVLEENQAEEETQVDQTPAAWVGLDQAGETQRDDHCAPEGTAGHWEVIARGSMTPEDRAYQSQIARTPPLPGNLMMEYRVTNETTGRTAMFDGCAYWSPTGELLEAKNWSGWMSGIKPEHQSRLGAYTDLSDEAFRQVRAAGMTHPVQWHVSNREAKDFIESAMQSGARYAPNFSAHHTPLQ